jgi:tetratricopeptide (TPR) repeat protein
MNKYDRALEDFDKALDLDPSLSVTYFNRGYIYQKMGSQDFAIADFQKACKLGNNEACNRLQSR